MKIKVVYNNEEKFLSEWADILEENYHTLYSRIFVRGMAVEDAFKPVKRRQRRIKKTYPVTPEIPDELYILNRRSTEI